MEPAYLFAKAVLKPWLKTWFRWHIEGLDCVPPTGPAIVAFNHIAYLDPFAAAYALDAAGRRPRFLAKSELFADRRIAWIIRGTGQIEVNRGSRDAPAALEHAYRALEQGELVVVFPEGTITRDPELKPMAAKTGAARLALGSGAPLIPAAVWGTQNIWPKGYAKHWAPRQDILVRIGTPIGAQGDPHDHAACRALSDRLMEAISGLVAALRPVVPDRRRPKKSAA
jgi:1-acyl-sn-glycerol-3-phosphate acyltransferase